MSLPQNSLPQWLNIKTDDIDGGLAADFDGSLSGLGVELCSSTYNMSEALLALPVFKEDSVPIQEQGFHYILTAATSPASKVNEETLTYLNQGQSYEIKLRKIPASSSNGSTVLKSIVRFVFHDKRLQYSEKEQMINWQQTRLGERVLDVDLPLSYGIHDAKCHPQRVNFVEFRWNPSKDTSVFIKVNCISTEFTAKKHGGEKGVPFRVQVETYILSDGEEDKLIHCASCQVKVFKPKGADRKQKTDKEKLEKRSVTEREKFQPSYECTVLTEIPIDHVKSYLESIKLEDEPSVFGSIIQPEHCDTPPKDRPEKTTHQTSPKTTPVVTCKTPVSTSQRFNTTIKSPTPRVTTLKIRTVSSPVLPISPPEEKGNLVQNATDTEVTEWLHTNRFSEFVAVFHSFTGSDLLRLSRDDLIQICGVADGIRLNNALQSKAVRPKLTVYICQETAVGALRRKLECVKPYADPKGLQMPPSTKVTADTKMPHYVDNGSSLDTSSSSVNSWQKKAEPSPNAYGGDPNAPQPSAVTDPNCVTDTSVDFSRLSFEKESEHMVAPVNLDFSQLSFGNVDMPTDSPKQSTPNKQPTVASKQKCPAISGNKPYVNSFEEIHATHKASETACSVKRTETDTYSPISRPVIAGSHNTSSKRQRNINVGEDNDDSQDEVLFSKKQRTRSLELPRTGVYHALYLDHLTLIDFTCKMAMLFSIAESHILEITVQGPSNIQVLVTDEVIQNFDDQCRFFIETEQDDSRTELYRLHLKLPKIT